MTAYNFTSTDPDGDQVSYFIDWGDDTTSNWMGPYPSGNETVQSHIWTKKGSYIIKAKAKDASGNESDWGTLSITLPLAYQPPQLNLLKWLLIRFFSAFPLLQHRAG